MMPGIARRHPRCLFIFVVFIIVIAIVVVVASSPTQTRSERHYASESRCHRRLAFIEMQAGFVIDGTGAFGSLLRSRNGNFVASRLHSRLSLMRFAQGDISP